MGLIALTRVNNGIASDANVEDNNQIALETLLNGGIDDFNVAAGALTPNRLKQNLATDKAPLIWDSTSGMWKPGSPNQFVRHGNGTPFDVVSTANETDLFGDSITIPADALGPNGWIHVLATGDWMNNTGSSKILTVALRHGSSGVPGAYVGGQKSWDTAAAGSLISGAANRRSWTLDCWITNNNATNFQVVYGTLQLGAAAVAGSGWGTIDSGAVGGAFGGSCNTNTLNAFTLKFTVTHAVSNAALSMRLQYVTVVCHKEA